MLFHLDYFVPTPVPRGNINFTVPKGSQSARFYFRKAATNIVFSVVSVVIGIASLIVTVAK